MSSTVTTATVTTMALVRSGSVVLILSLTALLIKKELLTASNSSRLRVPARALNFIILLSFLAFIFTVARRVIDILG